MVTHNFEKIKKKLKAYALSLGIGDIGIAPWPQPMTYLSILTQTDPCPFTAGNGEERLTGQTALPDAQAAIVCLFPYYHKKTGKTNLARYTWVKDYHLVVPAYLEKLAAYLKEFFPSLAYEIHCDTSPLADRQIAYQAGLGVFGRNHCLIHPKLGSFTHIGTLLLNIPLPADTPLTGTCMQCGACQRACPGQALWEPYLKFTNCKSYLTQKKGDLTAEEQAIIAKTPLIFGCDVCQEVCPHNHQIEVTQLAEWQNPEPYLDPVKLQTLSNREFRAAHGHKAYAWRGHRIILRNQTYIDQTVTPAKEES